MLKLNLRGERDIIGKLTRLPRGTVRRVISKSARAAMRPILSDAKANSPVKTGALRKSIKLRVIKFRKRGLYGMHVATSKKWFVGDQYYAAFQEFGWRAGKRTAATRSGIDDRPVIPGKHYLEQAYKRNGDRAIRQFLTLMRTAILTEAPK